jgi:hypothetical protein
VIPESSTLSALQPTRTLALWLSSGEGNSLVKRDYIAIGDYTTIAAVASLESGAKKGARDMEKKYAV